MNVFVTVRYAGRNNTADHHAAVTASPHSLPTRSAEPSRGGRRHGRSQLSPARM